METGWDSSILQQRNIYIVLYIMICQQIENYTEKNAVERL